MEAWRGPAYNDEGWARGAAPFYYGEPLAGGTVISDMRNRYSCIFLRRMFTLQGTDMVRQLRLRAICDDGFVAWINGTEVARVNMPAGAPRHDGYASSAAPEPVEVSETVLTELSFLRTGENVLAVQVFNNSLSSSDLQWDAELIATQPDIEPPRVASVQPAGGAVEELNEVTITFSEAVAGVRASDLLLGAQPALGVTGSGARYIFVFPRLAPGPIELRWDADTLITDLAQPPNRFDPVAAGTVPYQLVDLTPPTVAGISPKAGLTVGGLTQVTVRFSEPVEGVDATDLLVNGSPATNLLVTSAGSYQFQFSQPSPGQVEFSWAPLHGITDRADPALPFDGMSWNVELDPHYTPPAIRINEFLSSNVDENGLKDEDGELQDWIELHNAGATAANLDGWVLTDDRDDPERWVFPAVSIDPGAYLVVFASGKDRRPAGGGARLHTNFKLSPSGEYLALLSAESSRSRVSEFTPSFPEQRNDHSFGVDDTGQLGYFRTPTPGGPNGRNLLQGVVPPPQVSVPRGWLEAPAAVEITSAVPDTVLRYTTDGSEPTEVHGETYSSPLQISKTTVLRVAGFKANYLPSLVSTHTYLFVDDVLRQPNDPSGFPAGPSAWNGFPSDYELDPEIVQDAAYRGVLEEALLELPVLSIVCRTGDLFDAVNGIYTHPLNRGPAWERPCSVEFIPADSSVGFQVDAGVQIQGNASREPQKQPKHQLRLVFKGDYGPKRLEFPLFPDSPVDRFDTLVLRADFNFSWLHWNPHQRVRAQRTRDAWAKDTLRAMGGLSTHNRYVHLFLNGLYWGVYDPSERPDGAFAASSLGGEKELYDVINEGEVVDGGRAAYDRMLSLGNLATASGYQDMQRHLDLPQFIDYMLLHFYFGHQDWGQNKNWYAFRPKDGSRGFFYVPWDCEMILDELNHNRVSSSDTPSGLHTKLMANPEYRLAFADRVHKHLFNGGALTPEVVQSNWLKRARQVERAVVAESARWGDYRRDVHPFQSGPYELYTRDNHWRAEQNRLLTEYFPRRTSILLGQLHASGLYPETAPPAVSQFGGRVRKGFAVSLDAPAGTIYFTLDGTDPRQPFTGGIALEARNYGAPIVLNESVRLRARTFHQDAWSPLVEGDFWVGATGLPVRFTEVMYHPEGGDSFEFIELRNFGAIPIDLGGFSLSGVDYIFPHRTLLAAGEVIVLASSTSPNAFAGRYPSARVLGHFAGALSNGGERLALRDREGQIVTAVTYADNGAWPELADGQGFSLELLDSGADPNAPANWRASPTVHGSPGVHEASVPPASVRLNEIMAVPGGNDPDGSADWIELFNQGATAVSLAQWSLCDESGAVFAFPEGTVIEPGGFLLVWCDGNAGAPGYHAPFGLSRQGDTVVLRDAQLSRIDAVSFGPQVAGFALGRAGSAGDWSLTVPTPAAANIQAALASATNLRINEWLADSRPGEDDWLEVFNPDPARPAALKGVAFETDGAFFEITALSFVAPSGFLALLADERAGPDHVGFKLPANGSSITLLDTDGAQIDRIAYGIQAEGLSEGRLVDGGEQIGALPQGPTPGSSNVPGPVDRDTDHDGLPDEWEIAFGTDPSVPDAGADPDRDGLSNADEFQAGTNPNDPGSALQISRVQFLPTGIALEFPAAADRSYSVLYSDSLQDNAWRKLADVGASPTSRLETVIDLGVGNAARFYRVVTPTQP